MVRFGDDWLYQADIRQTLRNQAYQGYDLKPGSAKRPLDEQYLNTLMADGLNLLRQRFDIPRTESIMCRFPCNRTFEIELALSN